ncbi:MAG: hypothetical protein CML12_02385 [Puniceicoccaceae bacterium]|nr:hypothetical protein [Puniceicoccaceae bacterium]RCL30479.1 MAG: hypothetical protein DBX03_02300 [Puniceicoccaceae bacterium]
MNIYIANFGCLCDFFCNLKKSIGAIFLTILSRRAQLLHFIKTSCLFLLAIALNPIAGFAAVSTNGTHTVSGSIQIEGGTHLSGVEMGISNANLDVVTDTSGTYSANLSDGLPYMLTPYKAGYVFSPQYHYIENLSSPETVNFTATALPQTTAEPKRIFYYPNWAIYSRDFHVHEIPADYITHINYAFLMPFVTEGTLAVGDPVPIRENRNGEVITVRYTQNHSVGLVIIDPYADFQKYDVDGYLGSAGMYPNSLQDWIDAPTKTRGVLGQLIQLKKAQTTKGKELNLVASVGGWTLGQHFPAIASNSNFRTAFGLACLDFLEVTGFDGIDIDWEFPVYGGTDGTETIDGNLIPAQPHIEDEPIHFLDLMKSIRDAIGDNYELSIACAQNPTRILEQYVWPGQMDAFKRTDNILDYLDYVNTMTYDYGGYWSTHTTHNAPLYPNAADPDASGSVSELIDILLASDGGNVPAERMVMGLGYYGRAWKDITPGPNGDGLFQVNPQSGRLEGSWDVNVLPSEAATVYDFADLKFGKALNLHYYINKPDSGFVEYWDTVGKVPYLYNPNQEGGTFISYEDQNSLIEKIRFAKSRNLAGCMIWEITQDSKSAYLTERVDTFLRSPSPVGIISGSLILPEGLDSSGVTLTLSSPPASDQVFTTGSDGSFEFSGLSIGDDYTLSVAKNGLFFSENEFIFESFSSNQNLIIYASNNSYSISGRTTSQNGDILAGVALSLSVNGREIQRVHSSEDGMYSFDSVVGDLDYSIEASKLNYITQTHTLADLTSDQSGINFNLSYNNPNYALSGYVTKDGAVLADTSITIQDLNDQSSFSVLTDSEGYYSVALPKESDYQITPSRDHYTFSPSSVKIYDFNSDFLMGNFVGFTSRVSLSGQVVFEGEGLNSGTVTLTYGDQQIQTELDTQGNFAFDELAPDQDYELSFDSQYFTLDPVSITNLSHNYDMGSLSASHDGTSYNIFGIVSDESSAAMQGVTVSVSGDQSLSVETNNQGLFTLINLRAGRPYTLKFEKSGFTFGAPITFDPLGKDQVLSITGKPISFTALPEKVIVGYWHNWDSSGAPFMKLSAVEATNYNVVNVSFIETWKIGNLGAPSEMTEEEEGAHPKFILNTQGGSYTEEAFKADIQSLKNAGIPVLVSIGGQNGHVELNTPEEKTIYVNGIIRIIEEYGFDGIDIDYEGGSMTIFNGPANSLDYSAITDPELKYGIDAIREIHDYFGEDFIITTAPELYYVQEGRSAYPGASQFIPFLHNIRDILDYIHVQYYNFGSKLWSALDGAVYSVGDPDIIVAMTDMLITGFPLAGGTVQFEGLRADQVAIGLPAAPEAAGGVTPTNPNGYYYPTSDVIHALDYLIKGTKDESLDYTLRSGAHPQLRGIMTWSINWDATTNGGTESYEFANTYHNYFSTLNPETTTGTPYSWLDDHGLVSGGDYEAAALRDSDGDGYVNHEEYVLGTIPTDQNSSFSVQVSAPDSGNQDGFTVHWNPISGRDYELLWTNDLLYDFESIDVFQHPVSSYTDQSHLEEVNNYYRLDVQLSE